MKDNVDLTKLKVALVHDWLTSYGGAERVLEEFTTLFPKAPIFTTVYDEKSIGHIFPKERVHPSFMQKIPGAIRIYRKLLALMPRAFEEFDFSGYDLVLSSSSSCAKGVLTPSGCLHVSYVHTPMRYAWDLYPEYLRVSGFITRWAMRRQMPGIRQWDALSSLRVDYFLANSREVAGRIKKIYRRDSEVLHPPVNTDFFTAGEEFPGETEEKDSYYLVLSRFVPYKRIDLAIKACNQLERKLVVIGSGPQEKELKRMAGSTIKFTGRIDDEETREYYRNCRAFIFPGFEDFGITPVEAQACGRPVIAYGRGGALDTVIPDSTGVFFPEQSIESLVNGILYFETKEWDPDIIRGNAENFSIKKFHTSLLSILRKIYVKE